MLPNDHGLVFPGGYYLQTGEYKRFDHGLRGMRYQRTVAAANGEDFLYLFYNPESGTYIQLRYNLINQTVDTPLVCHGQSIFDGGEMVCFQAQDEPQKHHAIQVWQTPFTNEVIAPEGQADSLLFKVGNKEIVRGMAECSEVIQLIDKDDSYEGVYVDLGKKASDILDGYFWIDKADAEKLAEPLQKIRAAANAAVEEYEKVVRVRRDTQSRTKEVQQSVEELIKGIERGRFENIDDFVATLASLREQRGHSLGLKELRYVDETLVVELEETTAEWAERISRRCVDFLLTPGALDPYVARVEEAGQKVESVATVAQAKDLEEEIDASGSCLLLTETVATCELMIRPSERKSRTRRQCLRLLESRPKFLESSRERTGEGRESRVCFQLKLLEQTTSGYLDVCDSPQRCDEYLTKVMVQLEELEGRFAEFDDFVVQLAQRREDVYAAFESRKVSLVEKRNRRAESLASAAGRILKGINSRVNKMESTDEIAAYFAGDLMARKYATSSSDWGNLRMPFVSRIFKAD